MALGKVSVDTATPSAPRSTPPSPAVVRVGNGGGHRRRRQLSLSAVRLGVAWAVHGDDADATRGTPAAKQALGGKEGGLAPPVSGRRPSCPVWTIASADFRAVALAQVQSVLAPWAHILAVVDGKGSRIEGPY